MGIMKKLFSTLIVVILIAALAVAAVVVWQVREPVDVETESSNTKVIKAVEREEQVVLVSLGLGEYRRSPLPARCGIGRSQAVSVPNTSSTPTARSSALKDPRCT